MFPVLNSLMKTRWTVKSNERKSVLFTGHASSHALIDNELQYDILGCKIQNFTKYTINCTIECSFSIVIGAFKASQ